MLRERSGVLILLDWLVRTYCWARFVITEPLPYQRLELEAWGNAIDMNGRMLGNWAQAFIFSVAWWFSVVLVRFHSLTCGLIWVMPSREIYSISDRAETVIKSRISTLISVSRLWRKVKDNGHPFWRLTLDLKPLQLHFVKCENLQPATKKVRYLFDPSNFRARSRDSICPMID